MPKKRVNKADLWMPPRVYRGKSAFEFHPKKGGAIRLCGLNEPSSSVWLAYEKLDDKTGQERDTFERLLLDYYNSQDFQIKKVSTRNSYFDYKKDLLATFGAMPAKSIQPLHVRSFMDSKGNKSGPVQANRHKSALQVVMGWGYERGRVIKNPCIGIKKFKEIPRDVYVTDEEYQAILDSACPIIYAAAELAYLTMSRLKDVIELKKSALIKEGVMIKQSKTGVEQINTWGIRLKTAVEMCDKHFKNNDSVYVIHQKNGDPYSKGGLRTRWTNTKKRARDETNLPLAFTFHDLKAKGISDFDGSLDEKREAAGHTNMKQTNDYNRKPTVVDTVESKADTKKKEKK